MLACMLMTKVCELWPCLGTSCLWLRIRWVSRNFNIVASKLSRRIYNATAALTERFRYAKPIIPLYHLLLSHLKVIAMVWPTFLILTLLRSYFSIIYKNLWGGGIIEIFHILFLLMKSCIIYRRTLSSPDELRSKDVFTHQYFAKKFNHIIWLPTNIGTFGPNKSLWSNNRCT